MKPLPLICGLFLSGECAFESPDGEILINGNNTRVTDETRLERTDRPIQCEKKTLAGKALKKLALTIGQAPATCKALCLSDAFDLEWNDTPQLNTYYFSPRADSLSPQGVKITLPEKICLQSFAVVPPEVHFHHFGGVCLKGGEKLISCSPADFQSQNQTAIDFVNDFAVTSQNLAAKTFSLVWKDGYAQIADLRIKYISLYILKERKTDQRLPRVGGNLKSYTLAYDFSITAYTR